MTDLRQAAQLALEAWDDPAGMKDLCVAMDAIRTALGQQAEPVAWMDREGDLYKMPEIPEWAPPHTMLYTTPPQRKPLTVDQVWQNDQLMSLNAELGCSIDLLMEVVEAVEAAHGIKD